MAETTAARPRRPAKAVEPEASATATEKAPKRKIPGNLPYTTSAGVLRRVLEKIPVSERPSVFTTDFLATVMDTRGGAARPIPPILKATGLLNQNASPTELYTQFQTDGGRSAAANQALRNGFAEIFKRNTYAHKASESTLVDLVTSVTGLPKNDTIVRYMISTFQAFQKYAKDFSEDSNPNQDQDRRPSEPIDPIVENISPSKPINLAYNINIILPETTNVEVFNAIFKSLKSNLLS